MKLKTRDIVILAMMASMMIVSKKLMEVFPNVHLIGMFIVLLTVLYRSVALIPIYVYVFIDGLIGGFSLWWWPYLYVWTALWAMTMLIPQKLPEKAKNVLYVLVCALHGFAFGLLYMPGQMLLFGYDLKLGIAWWLSGLPFDLIHGVSNLFVGILITPILRIMKKLRLAE
jgi:energy-coupling factor transport system substrate-specific component